MSYLAAPASPGDLMIDLAPQERVLSTSCCQRAVAEALETADAMKSTVIVAMLLVGVTMLTVGFVAGLTTAWMWFG